MTKQGYNSGERGGFAFIIESKRQINADKSKLIKAKSQKPSNILAARTS